MCFLRLKMRLKKRFFSRIIASYLCIRKLKLQRQWSFLVLFDMLEQIESKPVISV